MKASLSFRSICELFIYFDYIGGYPTFKISTLWVLKVSWAEGLKRM